MSTAVQDQAISAKIFIQAMDASDQAEAYVRNDNPLLTSKKLSERLGRVKYGLATTSIVQKSTVTDRPHNVNWVDRLMLKKINKQINRHLAPNHPEKAMIANRVRLVGGIGLLLGGLLLLILGTGTAAFIGLIVALAGSLGVILGLFGE